jgi:integrase
MPLGTVKDVSLKEARAQLSALRKQVSEGMDPRIAKAAAKAENIQAITMQGLFDAWIDIVKLNKEISATWVKRHEDRWRIHLKAPLGGLFARDVTRFHLSAALDAMTRKGIREETRKALTTLNLMLDYGLNRHIDQNPARILKPKDFSATAARPRNRVLSLQELRQLWVALDQACALKRGNDSTPSLMLVTATAIKILILFGSRRAEVAGMRWDELNFDADGSGVWILPPERTKNRQSHTVYIPKFAIQLISALKPITGASPFVFNGQLSDKHIHEDTLTGVIHRLRGTAKGKKKKDLIDSPLADIPHFTIHDCRRSAATAWGEYLKIAPHVIERMLNHQPLNKLVATYQRAVYAEEQKEAWLAWGLMVEQQIANEVTNVVPLKFARSA